MHLIISSFSVVTRRQEKSPQSELDGDLNCTKMNFKKKLLRIVRKKMERDPLTASRLTHFFWEWKWSNWWFHAIDERNSDNRHVTRCINHHVQKNIIEMIFPITMIERKKTFLFICSKMHIELLSDRFLSNDFISQENQNILSDDFLIIRVIKDNRS